MAMKEPRTDETAGAGGRSQRISQVVALVAGVFFLAAGAAAFFAPAAFFDAAAAFEPYNEHFIRDIGAFQIGLGAVLLLAIRINDALVVALGGVGVGSWMHAVGHVLDRDLGGTPAVDIPFFAGLSVLLVAVAALRWASLPPRRSP